MATKETLEEFCDDKAWSHLYGYVQSVAELHNIEQHAPRQLRRKKAPSRFPDSDLLESTGSRSSLSTSDEYKISLFFPVLDAFLAELRRHFDEKNIEIMRSIQACHPKDQHFLDPVHLKPLVEAYV